MKKPDTRKQKPNKGLMFKANKIIRQFADDYNLTHCSFNDGYKMLINGQNIVYLYTGKLEYRIEGSKENKYLPVGEKNLKAMLQKELKVTGKDLKTVSVVRIVR